MALLDDKNLAAEVAKRARFRVHHAGTKLNQAELHELEALAAKRNQTQGELIRRLILRELEHDKTGLRPSAEMVEITACRLLLVNLLGPLAKGQTMMPDVFDGIVDMVKRQIAQRAFCAMLILRLPSADIFRVLFELLPSAVSASSIRWSCVRT
jgi:hypothetical protein